MKKKIHIVILAILILALNASYIVYGQLNDIKKRDDSKEEQYIAGLDTDINEITSVIDQEIDAYQILVGELEEKKQILSKLDRIKDYVDFDITSDLSQVVTIEKTTPLNLEGAAIVVDYSKKLNLNPSLLLGIIKLESNFNQYEVGTDQDRGYMQIIPQTEKWLARQYGHKLGLKYDTSKIFNPEYNIGLGAIYLRVLMDAYGNDYDRILSEYNRGPYNLKAYYQKHNTYSTSYSRGVLNREKIFAHLNK